MYRSTICLCVSLKFTCSSRKRIVNEETKSHIGKPAVTANIYEDVNPKLRKETDQEDLLLNLLHKLENYTNISERI